MPSLGGTYYLSQHKPSEVLMYLSDMLADGRMSEDDYNTIIPMITKADEEAYYQPLYVVESVGYDDEYISGIFTEEYRVDKHLDQTDEEDRINSVTLHRLNDPEFEPQPLVYVGEDEYGEPIFTSVKTGG